MTASSWETSPAACSTSADPRARGRAAQIILGLVGVNARDRSTVECELALRPGFSAQAGMPPTALRAPRGERPGLSVLTARPARYFYGRYPAGGGLVPMCLNARGPRVVSLGRARDGRKGLMTMKRDGTQFGSASPRRADSNRGSRQVSVAIDARRRLQSGRAAGLRPTAGAHGPRYLRFAN
jgi:hypothetical protein